MVGVARWCWDTGGIDPQVVYKRSLKLGPLRVIPIKGASTYGNPVITMPRQRNAHKVFLSLVGTDTAKDLIYDRLKLDFIPGESTPGAIHFPKNGEIFGETEAKQIVAEVLLPVVVKGKIVYRWSNQGRRNEALDCFVYALAALRLSMARFQINLEQLTAARKNAGSEKTGPSISEMAKKLGGGVDG